jgi:hypothetical protein
MSDKPRAQPSEMNTTVAIFLQGAALGVLCLLYGGMTPWMALSVGLVFAGARLFWREYRA